MKVWDSWGNLFGKTLWVVAITRRLTAEEASPSESGLVLGVPLPTPTITPDVEELQRRVGQRWGRGYGTLPGGTVVPMDAIINANRDRHPGEPKGRIVTEEEIANDPELQRIQAMFQAGAEQDEREKAAVAEATREAEAALAAAIATRVADATITAASSQDNSDAGDEHRPEYEIRNFESIVTDQGARAEILLDIYADGSTAGHQYSILHGRFEEGQWWVDCDRR